MAERDGKDPRSTSSTAGTDHVRSLSGEGLDAEVLATLEQRARAIAGVDRRGTSEAAGEELMFFSRRPLRVAVRSSAVVRILGAPRLTRIPCAPSLIARVVHVDGRIVSVVDPVELLEVGKPADTAPAQVLLIESRATWLGLVADEVHGLRAVSAQAIAPPTTAQGDMHPAVTGTAPGMTLVLDPAWLVEELKNRTRRDA